MSFNSAKKHSHAYSRSGLEPMISVLSEDRYGRNTMTSWRGFNNGGLSSIKVLCVLETTQSVLKLNDEDCSYFVIEWNSNFELKSI